MLLDYLSYPLLGRECHQDTLIGSDGAELLFIVSKYVVVWFCDSHKDNADRFFDKSAQKSQQAKLTLINIPLDWLPASWGREAQEA